MSSSSLQRVAGLLPGPQFPVAPGSVRSLSADGPEGFLRLITERVGAARQRVFLSALYLGSSGSADRQLVEALRARASESSDIRFSFLFDRWRGSRGPRSSVDMLRPVLQASRADQAHLALFRVPTLATWLPGGVAGPINRLLGLSPVGLEQLPPVARLEGLPNWSRLRELLGVQHLKLGIFDDSVLITGANLSQDYFSTRCDRYLLIENQPALADRLAGLLDLMSESDFSRRYSSRGFGDILERPEARMSTADPLALGAAVRKLCESPLESVASAGAGEAASTLLCLLPQFPGFGVDCDSQVTMRLLRGLPEAALTLSSPYLNLHAGLVDAMRARSGPPPVLVTGSDRANGFHGASGPAGLVPELYRQAQHSLRRQLGPDHNYDVRLWDREGWTFHSKGLWLEAPPGGAEQLEDWMLTLVGSSNFGNRSTHLDAELQFAVLTEDPQLLQELRAERELLLAQSTPAAALSSPQSSSVAARLIYPVMKHFM